MTLALTVFVMVWTVSIGEGIDAYYRSRLPDMVHGTAWRPYVTRALVPGLARAVGHAVPANFHTPLGDADHTLVILIMGASLFGFAYALRDLSLALFAGRPLAASVTAVVALSAVPLFLYPFSRQIYDFTTLWLVTLALACLARARWVAFAVVFVLATINKETSILLTAVFAVHFLIVPQSMKRSTWLTLLTFQVVVFAMVRGVIGYVFRHNDGGAVEIHLFDHNLHVLQHPLEMSKRLWVLGAAVGVGAWGWRAKPALLRHALLVLVPALLAMGVTVGQLDEIRAYYELFPVVALLAADTTNQRWSATRA
jgi:hypothetical protein